MADNHNMINFIEKWDKRGKKNTWSGTPYGIMCALKRQGIDCNEISLGENIFEKILFYINKLFCKISKIDDFGLFSIFLYEKELKIRKDIVENIPNLMFTQYRTRYIKDSYVFIDYSVQFLTQLKKIHPEIMYLTPLNDRIPESKVNKRNRITEEWTENCKGIFTMSEFLAKDYIERLGVSSEKIHCVGGGCNVDTSKIDGSQRNGLRFLFVGKHWEHKNGPLVVEAFSRLRETRSDIELYILGPQTEPDCVKNKLGIHFIGFTPFEETYKYYNLCDYFVMPSKSEAYGMAFGEALIFGLPCIAKDAFAMPEFVEEGVNGYLIKDDDVIELVEKMKLTLTNSEYLKTVVENNRQYYIDKYSWDTVAKKMINVMLEDGYFAE